MKKRQKRSKQLSLVLMGSLLATSLTGCADDPVQVAMFKNQDECVAAGNTVELCVKYEEEARKNAPKFSDRAECEKQFGTAMCSGGTDSEGSFWMPALAGFMIGNSLGTRDRQSAGAIGYYAVPNSSGFQTASGRTINTGPTGKPSVGKSNFSSSSFGRSAVSRGGFSGGTRSGSFGG